MTSPVAATTASSSRATWTEPAPSRRAAPRVIRQPILNWVVVRILSVIHPHVLGT
jgi:hypothetical protein